MNTIEYLARCHCGGLTAGYRGGASGLVGARMSVLLLSQSRALRCVHCVDAQTMLSLSMPKSMDYGAESPEARRLRRETHWTPVMVESL
jgi:hypothetical protein